jgi:predicted N-acetyltransferase YhbS
MYTVRAAKNTDAEAIKLVTQSAFLLYRDELHSAAPVYALSETADDIARDIAQNVVYVAEEDGKILGAIRYCRLSAQLSYIYRFAVDPATANTGIGTDLLARVVAECEQKGYAAIALHTNSKYYKLARYYYGKQFFVHSTDSSKGYIRALFVKELQPDNVPYDITPAFKK